MWVIRLSSDDWRIYHYLYLHSLSNSVPPSSLSAISNSDTAEGTPGSASRSMLDVLKAPNPADFARKRKVKLNQSPWGKLQCIGASFTDPKGGTPAQRVKEFPADEQTIAYYTINALLTAFNILPK